MEKTDIQKLNRKNKPLNSKEWFTFFFLPIFTTKPIWRNDHYSQSQLERFEKHGFETKLKQAKNVQRFGKLFWFGIMIITIKILTTLN